MIKKHSGEGKALTQQIKKAGYTVVDFCKETGISKSALYQYMSGEKEPTASKLLIMSKTLKVPLKGILKMLGNDVTGVPNDE